MFGDLFGFYVWMHQCGNGAMFDLKQDEQVKQQESTFLYVALG